MPWMIRRKIISGHRYITLPLFYLHAASHTESQCQISVQSLPSLIYVADLYTDGQCQVSVWASQTTNIPDSQMKGNPLTKNQHIFSPCSHTLEGSRSSGGKSCLLEGNSSVQRAGRLLSHLDSSDPLHSSDTVVFPDSVWQVF